MFLALSELVASLAPLAKMMPLLIVGTAALVAVMFATFWVGVDAGLYASYIDMMMK